MSQLNSSDGIACWTNGDTAVVLWKSDSRRAHIVWLFEQLAGVFATNPDGILVLQLVLPTSSPPDSAARRESQLRVRSAGKMLKRLVTVALGDALRLTIVRAIMRAIALISGQSKTQFVASTESEGIDRLLEAGGPATPSKRDLQAAIGALHRALDVPRDERLAPAT